MESAYAFQRKQLKSDELKGEDEMTLEQLTNTKDVLEEVKVIGNEFTEELKVKIDSELNRVNSEIDSLHNK